MSQAFNKVYSFVANLANGAFNLGSDTIEAALTNTTPTTASNKLSDITEISYTNCSARTFTLTSSTQSSGLYSLILQSLVLTASGTVGPFRYVVVYDASDSNKNIIGWFDYGQAVTMASGDTFTITPDQTNGLLQMT